MVFSDRRHRFTSWIMLPYIYTFSWWWHTWARRWAGGIGQFTSRIKSVGRTSLLQLECLHWAPVSLSSLRDWFPCLFTFSPRAFLRFAPDNWCQRESGAQWIAIGYRSHRVKHVYLGTQSTLTATDSVFERVSLKRTSWRYSAQDWLLRIGYCDRDVWMILFTS